MGCKLPTEQRPAAYPNRLTVRLDPRTVSAVLMDSPGGIRPNLHPQQQKVPDYIMTTVLQILEVQHSPVMLPYDPIPYIV